MRFSRDQSLAMGKRVVYLAVDLAAICKKVTHRDVKRATPNLKSKIQLVAIRAP